MVTSECPIIPEAREFIERTKSCLNTGKFGDPNFCEVASIGHDYTFHTHPRGTRQPSDVDIKTTLDLRKRFLCIGLVPTKKVICYDLTTKKLVCEHKV